MSFRNRYDLRAQVSAAQGRLTQSSARAIAAARRSVSELRFKHNLAAVRLRAAYLRFQELKGGFREDQPRWPKGSGESSGRWSGGAGTAEPSAISRGRSRGHHVVPQSITSSSEFNLSAEARQAFNQETTGRLYGGTHPFDDLHRQYNAAIRDTLRHYLNERGIRGEAMTAADAEDFIRRIYRSNDPRIERFNLYVYRQRLYHILRRLGPIGRE